MIKKLLLLFLLASMLAGCEDLPIGDIGDGDGGDDFAVAMHRQAHSALPYAAGPVIAPAPAGGH